MSWRNTYYTPVCDDSYKTNRTQRTFGTVGCFEGCSLYSWSSPSIKSICTDYSTSEDWATYEGEFNVTLPSSSTSYFIGCVHLNIFKCSNFTEPSEQLQEQMKQIPIHYLYFFVVSNIIVVLQLYIYLILGFLVVVG